MPQELGLVAEGQLGIPPLPYRNKSFLAFLATQFLGAFNDNVFKQLVLLQCVRYTVLGMDLQSLVQLLFALPFLLLSGLAGDLADKVGKGWMMQVCKAAEILVMLAGLGAFWLGASVAGAGAAAGEVPPFLWLLAGVTFLMGTQSAFFGPPKYGGLPELVRSEDLSPATGLTQMTTFLAVIFGVSFAGYLFDAFGDRLWIPGTVVVGIAIAGTWTARGIARNEAADPERRITARSLLSVLPTLRRIRRSDRLLWLAMLLYSWFWLVGGVSLTAINAYGRLQLGLSNVETSLMVASLSLGIAAGSALVGRLSPGRVRFELSRRGLVLMAVCLIALAFVPAHAPTPQELDQFVAQKFVAA
ncbi:MAG TPA: MFS transporter, partial [Planctomycetota bacterium]